MKALVSHVDMDNDYPVHVVLERGRWELILFGNGIVRYRKDKEFTDGHEKIFDVMYKDYVEGKYEKDVQYIYRFYAERWGLI